MIKKLDKMILGAYLGPFLITLPVIVFIFLVQTLLKYIDELVGKDIGFDNFIELIFYFVLNLTPAGMPLAILLGSLIAFGSLGEHNELAAIKSSGISLLRILRPIFFLVVFITGALFIFNDTIVPWANLKAYSLLYDLRHKKPALDIKEGLFYQGLPGYTIKVSKKFKDEKSLKGIQIYNHNDNKGNVEVIVADSGQMYTFMNDKYLAIELFNGNHYKEQLDNTSNTLRPHKFLKTNFDKSKIVFSLASFEMAQTEESLFKGNRHMKDIVELKQTIDSLNYELDSAKSRQYFSNLPFYNYRSKLVRDSIREKEIEEKEAKALENKKIKDNDTLIDSALARRRKERALERELIRERRKNRKKYDKDTFNIANLYNVPTATNEFVINKAVNQARSVKQHVQSQSERFYWNAKEIRRFETSLHQKYTNVIVCIIFFLIGAPLGAIIKKGGLGVPMIVCISLFVVYYIIGMTGEKWAKEDVWEVAPAIWLPIYSLLPLGLYLLRQAKNDSRIFESDIYIIWFNKLKDSILRKQKNNSI